MEAENHYAPDAAIQGETAKNRASASASPPAKRSGTAITANGKAVLTSEQEKVLKERGIDISLAKSMGWRAGQSGAIEIPYLKTGKEVNCKTRTIKGEKRFHQVKDGEKIFYNFDALAKIAEGENLIITEGEMDCLIAIQCGHMAVSVPDGAPKEKIGDKETVKYEYLHDFPKSITRIILCTDGDQPGINLQHDLAIRLGKHRCMWVKYPQGCKDLNDVFIRWGKRGVDETISRAQFLKIEGLYRMDDLPPAPITEALSVGVVGLEDHFRLRQGDISIITGIPSHGKSTFSNAIAFNMAMNHEWSVCFASFEQKPQTEHRRALRTLFNMRPAKLQTDDERKRADEFINKKFSFIVPNDGIDEDFDLVWLKDRMVAAVTRMDAKMIVIDPWNELDHVFNSRETTMTQYVGKAIKELKRLASHYHVHVMVIAHPAKMLKNKDGSYPIPSAYDISDSSHWYNKPDQVVVVHQNKDGTLIRIAKSRYHQILGKPADVQLKFDDYTFQYTKEIKDVEQPPRFL